MRKKITTLILFISLFTLSPIHAQYVWLADFTPATGSDIPDGWSTIKTPGATGHWSSMINNNSYTLFCQEKELGNLEHDPVKKEWIISPTISINNDKSYGVRFNWQGHPTEIFQNGVYDFHLAVSEDNGENWQTIWSASSKEDLEKSGVLPPWGGLASIQTSTVSLKDYGGKDIKIAYIYDLKDTKNGNMIRISTMGILPHDPVEGPMVGGSSSYTFSDSYMGVKERAAQSLHLINRGIGTLEVTAIEGLAGTDYSTDLVAGSVQLTAQQTYNFNVYYTPTPDGARSATMVIRTNGGDHSIRLDGTKLPIPTGYVLESFEGYEFPPAGWENKDWTLSTKASSGDKAVFAFFTDYAELISPVVDISAGNCDLIFDYAVLYESEYFPDNVFKLEQSDNEGRTWREIWNSQVYEDMDYTRIKLKVSGTEASRFRWVYEIEGQGSFDGDYTTIYLDNILMPVAVGTDSRPEPSSGGTPINGAIDQDVNELLLTWRGALHADGYRVYLGTNTNSLSLVATTSADDRNIYEANGLDYNTIYYWKVVPYNSYGEATNVPVWSFKTMVDQSIKTFPYFQGFEGNEFPELGWRIILSEGASRGWDRTDWNAYSGKYTAYVNVVTNTTGYSILQSPEVMLPEDTEMKITFAWGNGIPAGLSKSPGVVQDNDDDRRGDILYFEAKTPTTDWEILASCSQPYDGTKNWIQEKVLLTDYKGERVTFRWRLEVTNYSRSAGGALDDIEISTVSDLGIPVITYRDVYRGKTVVYNSWDAGILNYGETYRPGQIFNLANQGEFDLTIKSVSFDTQFFSTGLGANQVIKANESIDFDLAFIAIEHQPEIKDNLTIEFVDGQIYKFPITGSALGQHIYCYTFENEKAFEISSIADFKVATQGTSSTIDFDCPPFEGKGGSYAFMVMNYEKADFFITDPRSGKQNIIASGPGSGSSEKINWLISREVSPLENAQLRFYAKIMNDYWGKQYLTVLVSTTDNQLSSFVAVPSLNNVEVPAFSEPYEYQEYIVDLSQYAGQKIYVAIRHNTSDGFVIAIDDIYFENFDFGVAGERAPIFMTEPVKEGKVGETYTYSYTIRDLDDDKMKVEVKGLPSWMTHTETENEPGHVKGTLSGVPVTADNYLIRIEVTDGSNPVTQEFELKIMADPIVAIEQSDWEVRVYPNPVTDVLFLKNFSEKNHVSLIDIAGKQVYTGENVQEIPVRGLPEGMYIVRVNTDTGSYTTRIIKK